MKPEIREQVAQTIHAARETWHASRRSICGSEHDDQGRTLDEAIADAAANAIFTAVLPGVEAALGEYASVVRQELLAEQAMESDSKWTTKWMDWNEASSAARARVLAAVKGDG